MVALNRRVQVSDMFHFNYWLFCALLCVLTFENNIVYAKPPRLPDQQDVLEQDNQIDQTGNQRVLPKAPDNMGLGQLGGMSNKFNANQGLGKKLNILNNNFGQNIGDEKKRMMGHPPLHKNVVLATHEDCRDDIEQLCNTNTLRRNNFAILDCLQGDLEIQARVSEKCQHVIWSYKQNLTKDDRFDSGATEVCANVFSQIEECRLLPEGQGLRIPCLIEHMDNISDRECIKFLNKMGNIVFADYRLVYHFMENCKQDIDRTHCGRLDDTADKPHMQGNTILCLARKITELDKQCKKQVLRVAELQSDDYHLDRPLYYACRNARERLCDKVQAGNGKVFDCLLKHKNNREMEDECKDLLTVRQQLISQDVKVKKTFFEACEKDMKSTKCLLSTDTTEGQAERSMVLLCLENALKNDKHVSGACVAEMTELRRSLMEDYQITPEIVTRCNNEISHYCNNGEQRGGRTIHCLMEYANPLERRKKVQPGENSEFSDECRAALEDLLREADVGSDYSVDSVLAQACQEVLENDCKDGGDTGVINCLMEKVDSDHMTDECEDRLLEIQYFIVRDFKLDHDFYKSCHKDAVEYCHADQDWANVHVQTADASPNVLPCLYRHMKHAEEGTLTRKCEHEVKRVMRRRAKRIQLEPEVEEACLTDLGALCSDDEAYGKGEEMECLQDNLEDIEREECAELVKQFTEDQDEDLDLDTVLMKACTPMIKKFCEELLKHDAEAADVMECLVENKNHHEMNVKCKAGIEHHQLIQLKDIRFSHRFKEACKDDAIEYCKGKTKKSDIVSCLSEIVRDDILKEDKHRVSIPCRKQLRVEVLSRDENIDLDPDLKKACEQSIKTLCSDKMAGNSQVIECLKEHKNKLPPVCHKKIFDREVDEAVQGGDFLLFRECKQMIKTHCMEKEPGDIFDCLKKNMNSDTFEPKCRDIVLKRAMQETKDYRLNPSLAKACRLDIPKFCREVLNSLDPSTSNVEFQGKVVNCLKIHFIKKTLSRDCHSEIKLLVKETHLDINMDPVLMHACETQIRTYCADVLGGIESNKLQYVPHNKGDAVQQCLENKLYEQKIPQASPCGREIGRIIEEARVDVNVDPQLNAACQDDLIRWCRDVDSGEGQKMSCLLTVLEDYPDKMKPRCSTLLSKRKTLWEYAARYAPAESLSELSDQVLQSPAKNYLLGVLMTIVGIIFIVGITCGRVTKRVTREQKTK
ncbi:glycogenin glucosyltransferase glg1 [Mactra antiquata]